MCTTDAWRHKDSLRQCRGDMWCSEELEEGTVVPIMAGQRVAQQHTQQGCRMDQLSDSLAVLTT